MINLENILLKDPNDLSSITLIDFGFSIEDNNQSLIKQCGTIMYMAPEFIKRKKYGTVI